MLAQTFMSSRSLTQGLDIINMEPSMPGVRTSVINSYLSNTGGQNVPAMVNPNALMASLDANANANLVLGNAESNTVGAAPISNSTALVQQSNQDPTIVSPKIFSVIKNSIVQALNEQVSNAQTPGPSSNVDALLSSQLTPGSVVDTAGAQINSFVNSLIFTVQSQTNLSPQEDISATRQSPYESGLGDQSLHLRSSNSSLSDAPSSSNNYTPNTGGTASALPGSAVGSVQSDSQVLGFNGTNQTANNSFSNQQEVAQSISNVHGWVVGRIYSSMQSMIEMLAVTQSPNAGGPGISTPIAGLDSLIQSANSLFASMGLTSTVTASTLQTALQDIQRNLMNAPAQGQWINVVA